MTEAVAYKVLAERVGVLDRRRKLQGKRGPSQVSPIREVCPVTLHIQEGAPSASPLLGAAVALNTQSPRLPHTSPERLCRAPHSQAGVWDEVYY